MPAMKTGRGDVSRPGQAGQLGLGERLDEVVHEAFVRAGVEGRGGRALVCLAERLERAVVVAEFLKGPTGHLVQQDRRRRQCVGVIQVPRGRRDRRLVVALVDLDAGEKLRHVRVLRAGVHERLEHLARGVVVAEPLECSGLPAAAEPVAGFQPKPLVEGGDRVVVPPQHAARLAVLEPQARDVGAEPDTRAVVAGGVLVLAACQRHRPEYLGRVDILPVALEQAPADAMGLVEVA